MAVNEVQKNHILRCSHITSALGEVWYSFFELAALASAFAQEENSCGVLLAYETLNFHFGAIYAVTVTHSLVKFCKRTFSLIYLGRLHQFYLLFALATWSSIPNFAVSCWLVAKYAHFHDSFSWIPQKSHSKAYRAVYRGSLLCLKTRSQHVNKL